jgi:very-short-patch-repair endonuclease/restriction endonuclease S subunit
VEIVKLRDVAKYRKQFIEIDDNETYKRCRVQLHRRGVKLRDTVSGSEIKTKKQRVCKENDFIVAEMDAKFGGYGIIPAELDGAIVSSHYYLYELDQKKILPTYLDVIIDSGVFQEQIKAVGSTNYSRVSPTEVLDYEIPCPSLTVQKKIATFYAKSKEKYSALNTELTHQQTLLDKLRQAILQEAIEGKLTAAWRAQTTPALRATPPSQGGEFLNSSPDKGRYPAGGEGWGEGLQLNNLPHLKTFRQELRNHLTPAEAKLWTMLKGKQLDGRKFRRQHSVGNYILDFYCPAEKLAIELDGEVHNSAQAAEYDRERDLFLAHTGIKVIRFENKVVFQNPDGLLAEIRKWFGTTPALRATPPLQGGEFLSAAGREGFETAAQLLARIRAEKAQRVKEKKIAPQKPLPPLKAEEIPFALPEGWVWCRIGQVGIINRGKGPKYDVNGKKKIINQKCVRWFYVDTQYGKTVSLDWYKSLSNEIKTEIDDILVNSTGDGTIGRSAIVDEESAGLLFDSHILRLKTSIKPNYITLVINSRFGQNQIESLKGAKSTKQTELGVNNLSNLIIPLPPLAEQQAIAAKVERLLAVCDELAGQNSLAQNHAAQLMQAVLKEAFEENRLVQS